VRPPAVGGQNGGHRVILRRQEVQDVISRLTFRLANGSPLVRIGFGIGATADSPAFFKYRLACRVNFFFV
jgi:hypothetical protein